MKKIVLIMVFLMLCGVSHAATVLLKNGSTVSGTIIERTADAVKLDVSGVTLTYYNDEIQNIDSNDAAAPAPKKVPEQASVSPVQEQVQPVAAQPAVAEPMAAKPAVIEPAAAQPAVVEPMAAKPAIIEPAAVPPTVAQPAVVEPVAAAPAIDLTAPAEPSQFKADPYAGLTKRELILKFIDAFGTRNSMQVNFDQIIQRLPPEQAAVVKSSFKVSEIIDELVPLYDKRFSEDDLKAYIDFYSSPVGQKLVGAIPRIMNDSVAISEKYFESHLPKSVPGSGPIKPAKE